MNKLKKMKIVILMIVSVLGVSVLGGCAQKNQAGYDRSVNRAGSGAAKIGSGLIDLVVSVGTGVGTALADVSEAIDTEHQDAIASYTGTAQPTAVPEVASVQERTTPDIVITKRIPVSLKPQANYACQTKRGKWKEFYDGTVQCIAAPLKKETIAWSSMR